MPKLALEIILILLMLLLLSCKESKTKQSDAESFECFATSVTFRNTECNDQSGCKPGTHNERPVEKNKSRPISWTPYIMTTNISANKTETGAFAAHALEHELHEQLKFEAELNTEEWTGFIKDLYKCCVSKWKNDSIKWEKTHEEREWHIKKWELKIYYSDELSYEFEGNGEYPQNWKELLRIMSEFQTKIKKKAVAKIRKNIADSTLLLDERDGKIYKIAKIGTQTWMAENLNYYALNSKCNAYKLENCAKYGRMYNWYDAMAVCPAGWHLPSENEWQTLVAFAGGNGIAGKKLKAKSGWDNYKDKSGNGTDDYGFSALPGSHIGYYGEWWSSTDNIGGAYYNTAYHQGMYYHLNSTGYDPKYFISPFLKAGMISVRCIKD